MKQNSQRHLYFLCNCSEVQYGGHKKIYDQVDFLNGLGYKAFVVHPEVGFRYTWFPNQTPIVYLTSPHEPLIFPESQNKSVFFTEEDILVTCDVFAFRIWPYIRNLNLYQVIFNQAPYFTFKEFKLPKVPFDADQEMSEWNPYHDPNLLGVMTVSEDSMHYLKFTFPEIDLYRIHVSINSNVFQFQRKKSRKIAFIPRKCIEDATQVVMILKDRNRLQGWEFVPIENKSEREVAEILGESAIFLSFLHEEGFGLPPIEAMASGCIIIGYHGQGAKEYFKPPHAYPIDHEDIISFAEQTEKIALDMEERPEFYANQAEKNSEYVHSNYSLNREVNDLRECWEKIIKKHDRILYARP